MSIFIKSHHTKFTMKIKKKQLQNTISLTSCMQPFLEWTQIFFVNFWSWCFAAGYLVYDYMEFGGEEQG